MQISKIQKNNGYAILFTVVVVSVIMFITLGVSNIVYKELILAAVATDSQTAFYQADTASECGLYADIIIGDNDLPDNFPCGKDKDDNTFEFTSDHGPDHLILIPDMERYTGSPCFSVEINKDMATIPVVATMSAMGYSNCDLANVRTVERKFQITY